MSEPVVTSGAMPDLNLHGEITKTDDDKRLVFGWAYIVEKDGEKVVDKSGDFVDDIEELEKAAYDFVLKSRDGGDSHARKGVSTMIESIILTPEKVEKMGLPEDTPIGWWVGYKVHDDKVWKAVKDGKYKSFSIHGTGLRKKVTKAVTAARTSASIRQSYMNGPDGQRRWTLSVDAGSEQDFDTFEEALDAAKASGYSISKIDLGENNA